MVFSIILTKYTTRTTEMFNNTSAIVNDYNISTTEDPAQSDISDEDEEVARLIEVSIRPILFIFGTYGNAVSFYIMRRGSLKKVSTCFYMAILAIADTREYIYSIMLCEE